MPGDGTVIPKSFFTIAFMVVLLRRQIITFRVYGLWFQDVCPDNDGGFTAPRINLYVGRGDQRRFLGSLLSYRDLLNGPEFEDYGRGQVN